MPVLHLHQRVHAARPHRLHLRELPALAERQFAPRQRVLFVPGRDFEPRLALLRGAPVEQPPRVAQRQHVALAARDADDFDALGEHDLARRALDPDGLVPAQNAARIAVGAPGEHAAAAREDDALAAARVDVLNGVRGEEGRVDRCREFFFAGTTLEMRRIDGGGTREPSSLLPQERRESESRPKTRLNWLPLAMRRG